MLPTSSSFIQLTASLATACWLAAAADAQTVTDTPVHDTSAHAPLAVAAPRATAALPHEDLDATLWMQTSSEYRSACLQTYRAAQQQLCCALAEPTTTAALEQRAAMQGPTSDATRLPPAVILDVDETVLDNSAFQAYLIETGGQYDPGDWDRWIATHTSPPIPGVLEFLAACREAGVTTFFVTNRRAETKPATRENLKRFDLIRDGGLDNLLCKGDQPTWTSDKTTRRAHIAKSYRILLLVGDDLNDFVSVGIKPSSEARRVLADEHADEWGANWFILPNPVYGGWERAIHNWQDNSSRETKLNLKRSKLILE